MPVEKPELLLVLPVELEPLTLLLVVLDTPALLDVPLPEGVVATGLR